MQTARLSIVDLAGSERTKNTGNTGEIASPYPLTLTPRLQRTFFL